MIYYIKPFLFTILVSFIAIIVQAQTGIGTRTPDNSAALDIVSTNKGVLLPQYALQSLIDPASPVNGPSVGSLIYNTGNSPSTYSKGYYYWSGAQWERLIINNDVDQILKIGYPVTNTSIIAIPNGITDNFPAYDASTLVNNIVGGSVSGNVITLPAGFYRIDVTFDCVSENSKDGDSEFLGSGRTENLFIINTSFVNNVGNIPLTDIKVGTSVSSSGNSSIQGYKSTFMLQLLNPTAIKLRLNHNNGGTSTSTSATYFNHLGLAVTIYKFFKP